MTDSHPECGDGEFYNGLTDSCTTCPTEGSPVQNDSLDAEDTCEKCVGSRYGGDYPSYCVYCPDGVACNNQCCGEGQMCQRSGYTYTCVSTLGDGKCWTNDDCTGANQYCQNDHGCEVTVGTCETISSTTVTINGKEYTASTNGMEYHAAENFCDALGKKLAPVTDGCTTEELAAVKANNYRGSCTGWAHTTGTWYWTATKVDGCSSYYVESNSSGAVGPLIWNYYTDVRPLSLRFPLFYYLLYPFNYCVGAFKSPDTGKEVIMAAPAFPAGVAVRFVFPSFPRRRESF